MTENVEVMALKRYQHVKDRAVREGLRFDLSLDFFKDSLLYGMEPEMIFPDITTADSAAWEKRKLEP